MEAMCDLSHLPNRSLAGQISARLSTPSSIHTLQRHSARRGVCLCVCPQCAMKCQNVPLQNSTSHRCLLCCSAAAMSRPDTEQYSPLLPNDDLLNPNDDGHRGNDGPSPLPSQPAAATVMPVGFSQWQFKIKHSEVCWSVLVRLYRC